MNATVYLVLCTAFIAFSALVAVFAAQVESRRAGTATRRSAEHPDSARRQDRPGARMVTSAALASAVLILLTAVFDNLMIAVGLFTYEEQVISGLRVGLAPLEDFSYPVAAVILLPALWLLVGPTTSWRRTRDR